MRKLSLSAGLILFTCSPLSAQEEPVPATPFELYDSARYGDAADAAEKALRSDPENAVWWALLGEARARLDDHAAAAEAFARAARYEPRPDRRSYFSRAQAYALANDGRYEQARAVIKAALGDPALDVRNSLDWAMVAIAARDDAAAQEILANEALWADLTRQTALDAGYSAKRAGLDRRAVRFFERGLALDAEADQPLSEQQREAIRRENRELSRRWSFLTQASYSSAGGPVGPSNTPLGDERALQFGAEAALRIGGWRNGRPFSVFGRVYHSEFLSNDAFADNATQAWFGMRYKPFSALNLNLEASRLIALDDDAIDDWSVRAAMSAGRGLEPELDRRSWSYVHAYGDMSYLFANEVALGLAEGRVGHSFLLDERATTITPYAVVRLDLDTGRTEEWASGVGAGISLRHWFAASDTHAPRAFVDFDIQARERIAGDRRASGILATVTLGR